MFHNEVNLSHNVISCDFIVLHICYPENNNCTYILQSNKKMKIVRAKSHNTNYEGDELRDCCNALCNNTYRNILSRQ